MKILLYAGLICLSLPNYAQDKRPAFLPLEKEEVIHYTRLDGSMYVQHNGGKFLQVQGPSVSDLDQGQLAIGSLQSPRKIIFTMSNGTELVSHDGLAWAKSSAVSVAGTADLSSIPILESPNLQLGSSKLLIGESETDIYFSVETETRVVLNILTPEGKVLYESEVLASPYAKNTFLIPDNIPEGIYGYTLTAQDGSVASSVFIKH